MSINAKRFGNTKASLNASASRRIANVKNSAPLFHAESLPVNCVEQRVSSVSDLLNISGPLAVFLAVSRIVVNPFNGKPSRWLKPHIFKKVLKGSPAIRYGYTSSAVIFVAGIFRVGASLNHMLPADVFRRSTHSVHRFQLIMKAAARARGAISEVIAANNYRFTAFASTIPMTAPRFVPINDGKAGKGIATLQYFSGHIFSKLGAAC